MIRSMTGYGIGECTLYNRRFTVEIKSVNSRYNELSIKMPRALNSFEKEIKNIISEEVSRGKTDVYINYSTFSSDDLIITVNENLLEAYVEKLHFINEKYSLKEDIPLSLLTSFEGVLKVDNTITNPDILAEIWETLFEATNNALANFIAMREEEGESLKKDILLKIYDICTFVKDIKELVPDALIEHQFKLRKKVQDALNGMPVDEARLLTELAIQSDKSSIDEEIVRLESHILQMSKILEETGQVGRKLDFLVQEMNREINTVGSKSSNIAITTIVVELKTNLEKIREQIQNIE